MTVKELFEKYCAKEGSGYICHGRCLELTPASEEEIRAFRNLCDEHGVEQRIVSELEEYYRQKNSNIQEAQLQMNNNNQPKE